MENTHYDLQDYNPLQVGMNIRLERKKAGVSISNLSDKVNISAGKISYLEKGKITKEHLPEIEAIAECLRIPLSYILNDESLIKPPIDKYYSEIELGLQFIAGGMKRETEQLIENLKTKITPLEKKWIQPALLFLEAENLQYSGERVKASQYFSEVANLTGHHSLLNHYKVRSLNALACDSFEKRNITEALNYAQRALIHSDKNISAEQRSNTYYNMAIFYGFIGYSDVAIMHAKNAETLSHDNTLYLNEVRFALGILYAIIEDGDQATFYISEALDFYQKIKKITGIYKMYKCFYILYRINPHKHASIRTFFEEDYLNALTDEPKMKINYLHIWIEIMIEQKQMKNIESQIDYCLGFSEKMPPNINYKTYWLASLFYKNTNQSLKQEVALSKALSFIDDTRISEKAHILFELAKLKEPESESLYKESASLFQELDTKKEKNHSIVQLLNLIPEPRY
ncbi:helix-turn-helix domain-containing protein [Paenibacillus periandrae]|uniref:helix-turn-helix domain-containing protein n=1 Tax=Paenibacillus periandrae TaxID=1761741 RepID=UPI001F09AD41|nr:helix-turn-helix transcriptional regulator [Paenibacillus periandrae]